MAHRWFRNPKSTIFFPLLIALAIAIACGAKSTPQPGSTATTAPAAKPTAGPDLAALYRQLLDATNRGDLAGVLALYTDDAVWEDPGCPTGKCVGKEAIGKRTQNLIDGHTRFEIADVQVSGNTLKSRIEVRADLTRAAGVERFVSVPTVTFKGDKILRNVIERDLSDPQTVTFLNFGRVSGLHQRFIDAVAKGDEAGALALFADGAKIEGRGLCPAANPCVTKDAIQKEVQRVIAAHTQATLKNVQVSGDSTTALVEVRSDDNKAAGIERLVGSQTVEARGDKIAAIRFKIDTTDPQTATYLNFQRLSGLLRQHIDAVNKGDVAAVVATLTDDGVLVRGNRCTNATPCVGKEAIQAQAERDRTGQLRLTAISVQASGDTVTARVEFRNDNTKAAGIERIIENVTATVKGDKFSRLVHEIDLSDPQSAGFANFRRLNGIRPILTDAINLGNLAAAMAAFTDDAVFEGYGLCAVPCSGKVAIQKEMEREVADKIKIAGVPGIGGRVSGDNTITQPAEIRSDSIRAAGVERVIGSITYEIKGDKFAAVRFKLDPTDAQTAAYLKSLTAY